MSVTARSSLLFLIITLLLSVVPPSESQSHCTDTGILVRVLVRLCFQLDATLVHSLDGIAKDVDDNLSRLLTSETGLHVIRYCSPIFHSPDSLLLKKLETMDVGDLAEKLQAKQLCDKHVCEELVRTMLGYASDEVRLSDMAYIRREMCTPTPTPPSPTQSQSNNNNTMAVPTSESNTVPTSTEPPVPAVARAPTTASGSTKHAPATAPAPAPGPAPATSGGSKHTVASLLLFVLLAIGFRYIV